MIVQLTKRDAMPFRASRPPARTRTPHHPHPHPSLQADLMTAVAAVRDALNEAGE